MARKVITSLVDDVDGSEADRTVTFAFEGISYEIDLSEKNAEAFESALAPWVEKARRASGGSTRVRRSTGSTGRRAGLDEVRRWARDNGHQVSDRGRVPNAVLEAYDAAH